MTRPVCPLLDPRLGSLGSNFVLQLDQVVLHSQVKELLGGVFAQSIKSTHVPGHALKKIVHSFSSVSKDTH